MDEKFDLETLFKEWYALKKKMSELNDRDLLIKKMIHKIMSREKTKVLESDNFKVTCKEQQRRVMKQSSVPLEIFDKYASTTTINVLYLKRV